MSEADRFTPLLTNPDRIRRLIPELRSILTEVEGYKGDGLDRRIIGETVERISKLRVGIHPRGGGMTEKYRPASMEHLASDIRQAICDMEEGLSREVKTA